jgi:hypothetical protein
MEVSGMLSKIFRPLLCILILLLAARPIRQVDAQETREKPGARPYYSLLTEGVLSGPVFPYQFQSIKLRVEIRNLILGHSKAANVPTPTDIVMELREGYVITTINGQKQERTIGDFWSVEKGAALSIESPGQVAVIRAVYLYPSSK